MIHLLVIADDFTGALDASVPFAAQGIPVQVVMGSQLGDVVPDKDVQVLSVNAETRHRAPGDAYRIVKDLVARAGAFSPRCIYKKTDSALRGNIGAELAAVLDAAGGAQLHFVPAFPQMQRVTLQGVQYVAGVPVAESVFGEDPFEPVRESLVEKLVGLQTSTPISRLSLGQRPAEQQGILVYDAQSEADMRHIACRLMGQSEPLLLAGCAGFAATLTEMLGLQGPGMMKDVPFEGGLLAACGSINPISVAQCDYAQRQGAPRFRLRPAQKYTPGWAEGEGADALIDSVLCACREHALVALDTGGIGEDDPSRGAGGTGMEAGGHRLQVITTFGVLLKRLLDEDLPATIMVMGGDTLMGFVKHLGVTSIFPLYQLAPGVVVSRFTYAGAPRYLVSKSGGFGDETLFCEVSKTIMQMKKEREACKQNIL